MAIAGWKLHWKGATGSYDYSKGGEYVAIFLVWTDTPMDQAKTIIDYFQYTPSLPPFESFYQYGNDIDEESILTRISPERAENSALHWYVKCQYTPRDKEDQARPGNDQGKLTRDPAEWIRSYTVSYTQISVPVWKATVRGGFKGVVGNTFLPDGKETIPQNSALVPFEPGLEKDLDIRVVTTRMWKPKFEGDWWDPWIGVVNKSQYDISSPDWYGFTDSWKEGKARIKGVQAHAQFIPSQRRYWWEIEVVVYIHPLGWIYEVVDRGCAKLCKDGDPDGNGGTYSATDFLEGQPRHEQNKDKDGTPISEPLLFNGEGAPLHQGATIGDAVWLKWQVYEEKDYYPLGLG